MKKILSFVFVIFAFSAQYSVAATNLNGQWTLNSEICADNTEPMHKAKNGILFFDAKEIKLTYFHDDGCQFTMTGKYVKSEKTLDVDGISTSIICGNKGEGSESTELHKFPYSLSADGKTLKVTSSVNPVCKSGADVIGTFTKI